jgi:dimethylaniline monooxygenase (N-oxide forming)
MVYRSAHWMVDPKVARRVKIFRFTSTRLSELMVHKPGEGFALGLLATILTPLVGLALLRLLPMGLRLASIECSDELLFLQGWVTSKLTEAYYKWSIPMREHGMEPDCGLGEACLGWRLGILPEGFYDRVDEGSIELRRYGGSVSFCANGLVLDAGGDGGERIVVGADVVILCTGFDIDRPLRDVFASSWFGEIIAADDAADVLPLYRHILHPRIPQAAVVGYVESGSSIHPYEMMAKWVAHLLDGAVRLPGVRDMERGAAEWAWWGRGAQRRCGGFFLKSCVASVVTWYHDQLCRDMGHRPRRKTGILAEWLQPYGPTDYADIQ